MFHFLQLILLGVVNLLLFPVFISFAHVIIRVVCLKGFFYFDRSLLCHPCFFGLAWFAISISVLAE